MGKDIITLGAILAAAALLILAGGALFASVRANRGAKTNNAWLVMGLGLVMAGSAGAVYQFAPNDYSVYVSMAGAAGALLVLVGAFMLRAWMNKMNS